LKVIVKLQPPQQPDRDPIIDAVRTLACLGVIICHVVGPFRSPDATESARFAANLLDTLSRPAVGVFFMLAGMFALRRTEKIAEAFLFRRGQAGDLL
jgi:surface polysaccharide O-acyltransferase-like enzyme